MHFLLHHFFFYLTSCCLPSSAWVPLTSLRNFSSFHLFQLPNILSLFSLSLLYVLLHTCSFGVSHYINMSLFPSSYAFSIILLQSLFLPLLPLYAPASTISPESLKWYLSGLGPINPASLCLFCPSLIRGLTGDILLLLVLGV